MFYGVSKTLDFSEKWNITVECESPAYNSRIAPTPMYFKWIGEQGDQTMFSFNTVMGARIINLPLDGRSPQTVEALYEATGQERAKRLDPAYDKPRATGIVGIRIGPGPEHEAQSTYAGIAKNILIQNLRVDGCETGLGVGGHTYESDTAHIRITDAHISGSAKYGVVVNSTMAVVQMENAVVSDSGISNVRLFGGDLGLLQYCGLGNSKKMVADIELRGGALRVIGAWSETYAPFVRADYKQNYYPNWPRLIAGVVHGSPYGGDASIVYDSPAALNLMGCGFRGDVVAGPKSGPIFAQGVSFGNPIGGFRGEGITRYGRLVQIGTPALKSDDPSRAIVSYVTPREYGRVAAEGTDPAWNDPYISDRRSRPGAAPPTAGVWARGDRILNVEPDPTVEAKAWAGWICIEAGEPGKWAPYGKLGEAIP